MSCKVIAIENQKGGTGKSTTALNLGVGLHNAGKKVLLIDADPQGALSISLGIKRPDELDISLATVMGNVIDNKPFEDDFGIIHCDEGIDLMPCNVELSGIESYLFTVMSRECIMRTYVNQIKKYYDYILIDCTPSLGLLPINAFVAADSIIVPSQPRILSTKGLDLRKLIEANEPNTLSAIIIRLLWTEICSMQCRQSLHGEAANGAPPIKRLLLLESTAANMLFRNF